MNDETNELEDLLESPALRCGVYGLWLRVFVLSVKEIRRGYGDTAARAFLYDPENVFFDYVSECLGYEPDAMRERIRKSSKGGPGLGVFDLSHHEAIHEPHKDRNASQVI